VLVHLAARYVVCVRARFRLYVCATAMYVARMRSGVSAKSDKSDTRLAELGDATNTNPKRGTDKIGQNALVLRSILNYWENESRVISMLKISAGEMENMNAEIKELVDQLPISSDVQKSIANRLDSALTKNGSASSRLRMASQSMNALANKYEADTDENGYADLFARIFAIGALIGVDNKKDSAKKTTRENWHDADSAEGQAIIASKTSKPKPRKTKSVDTANSDAFVNLIDNLPLDVLLEALAKARR